MTSIHGDHMNNGRTVIADSDVIISLYCEDDVNHSKVFDLIKTAAEKSYEIHYPNTVILEAVTSLRRALNKPDVALKVTEMFKNDEFNIIYVEEEIQKLASEIFATTKSKQNTIFDCVVLATAKLTKAAGIFSFDDWYKKMGVKTLKDLVILSPLPKSQ